MRDADEYGCICGDRLAGWDVSEHLGCGGGWMSWTGPSDVVGQWVRKWYGFCECVDDPWKDRDSFAVHCREKHQHQ